MARHQTNCYGSVDERRSRSPRRQRTCKLVDGEFGERLERRFLLTSRPSTASPAEVYVAARPAVTPGRIIDRPDAEVYLPAGYQSGRTYPIVIVFTPDGKINRTLGNWRAVAGRLHWIVYASKDYSNAAAGAASNFDQFARAVETHVVTAIAQLSVDKSHVVLAGFSGGGFMAEYLNALDPGLASALVIDASGFYEYGQDPELPLPDGSNRPAAFLFSPADSRFGPATRFDRSFYQAHGWSTLILSYPGGHVDAPRSQYLRAATWVAGQPAWHK
jgi:poly(3-hydroxybutyrate) depolymerase